jgi:hypothetical protein
MVGTVDSRIQHESPHYCSYPRLPSTTTVPTVVIEIFLKSLILPKMTYPPPSEVDHTSRAELKSAQMSLNKHILEHEQAKQELEELEKATKTRKGKSPSPSLSNKDYGQIIYLRGKIDWLREDIQRDESRVKKIKKSIRNALYYDMPPEPNTQIEYGPRPRNATPNEHWFQTTSDEERTRPSFLSTSDEEPARPSFLSSSDNITTDEEELPSPPDSPLSVPYQPEEASPPPPPKHVEFGPLPHAGIHRTLKRFPKQPQQ